MMLSQATSRFNDSWFDVLLEDGTWRNRKVCGTLQVYDRFISNKTFGNKKRILMIGAQNPDIPKGVTHLRAMDGTVFMLAARNMDMDREGVYAAVYMITECAFQARVEKTTRAVNAHGIPVVGVPVLGPAVYCDVEAYSSSNSTTFPAVKYSTFSVSLPRYVDVTTDDRLLVTGEGIEGERAFDVKEVSPLLLTKAIVAVEAGQ